MFVCKWDKDKKKTWSGTPYSLREALSAYFDIVDCEIQLNFFQKVIAKLFSFRIYRGKLISLSYIFNPYYMNLLRKKAKKGIKKFSGKHVLEIGDYFSDNSHNISVYQDLCIDYVLFLQKNNPEIYEVCGHFYPSNILIDRNRKQVEFYKNCDHIFVMGKWLEDFLMDRYHEKITYVGAGYNAGYNNYQVDLTKKQKNKFLFVGRDFIRKGGDIVLEAFRKAKKKRVDLELYIAGNSDVCEEEGVKVLGDIPNDKIGYYYNLCDVLCMPSRFEAFGIVFVEALYFGLPVIAADAFEMQAIVQDGQNGLLLKDYNADELSELMLEIFEREDIFENVIRDRNKVVSNYSWASVAQKMYKKLKEDGSQIKREEL